MKSTSHITRISLFVIVGALSIALAVFFIRGAATGLTRRPQPDVSLLLAPGALPGIPDATLPTLRRTLQFVDKSYLDASRIQPRAMLLGAVMGLQQQVSQLVAEEQGDSLLIRVGATQKRYALGDVRTTKMLQQRLQDVFAFLYDTLPDTEIKPLNLEYVAINGLLATLDPHSVLMPPEDYRSMKDKTHGNFGGLGIVISIRDGELTVISPIEDTPAARAGLQAGDKIQRIEDISTVNLPLNDAVDLMRGKPGTVCRLQVMRKDWQDSKSIRITRAIIEVKSVDSEAMAGGVGYIRIRDFQSNTAKDVLEHLARLDKKAPLKGLVLDLRSNPGGLLDAAISVSDLFLKKGVIVTTAGKELDMRSVTSARDDGFEPAWPIAVLVNPGSASASEIVAGALRNNDRAVIIGEQTFGKGSVQVLHELPGGAALKITSAQYLTPGDISIQSVGISPHISTRPIRADSEIIDLKEQIKYRESDLSHHLGEGDAPSTAATPSAPPEVLLTYLVEPKKDKKSADAKTTRTPEEIEFDDDEIDGDDGDEDATKDSVNFVFQSDFNIDLARDIVLRMGAKKTTHFDPAQISGLLDAKQRKESERLMAAFKRLGIDWSPAKANAAAPHDLRVTAHIAEGTVQADAASELTVTVTNHGREPIHRLLALTRSDFTPLDQRELAFGRVAPGQTLVRTLSFKAPKAAWSAVHDVRVTLEAEDGQELVATAQRFAVVALPTPRFSHALLLDDREHGNGDGLLQTGERASILCHVRNEGPGDALSAFALLSNKSGSLIFLTRGREELKTLAVGETAVAQFDFEVKTGFPEDAVQFDLSLMDAELRYSVSDKLHYPLTQTTGQPGANDFAPPKAFNTPPVITLDAVPPPVVTKSTLRLKGVAQDDDHIRSVYIFVGDQKVYFQAASDPANRTLAFNAEVPLRLGMNYITIVAEEHDRRDARAVYLVRRDADDGMPWVAAYTVERKTEPLGIIPQRPETPSPEDAKPSDAADAVPTTEAP